VRKLILALSLVLLPGLGVGSGEPVSAATSGSAIVHTALRYVGYAYSTVGNSPSTGFSCIGFVSYVYQSNGIPLPDDLGGAMGFAAQVPFSDLVPGDVLYFANTVWPGLSHTAIYIGGGRFVHAEWYNRGVVISSFTNDPVDFNYWQQHYLGANRPWTGAATAPPAPPAAPAQPAPISSSPTPVTLPRPVQPSPPPLQEGPRARVQVIGLNVRLRPSLYAPIERLVTNGTTVVVLKQYGLWDWVEFPNRSYGWVAGMGIGVSGSAPSMAPAATHLAAQPIALSSTSVDGLRVHVRPGLSATVVTSVYRGQKLLVMQRWSSWARIQMADGTRGWVYSAFLTSGSGQRGVSVSSAAAPRRASSHPSGPHVTVTVRVHSRPGLRAPVLRLAAAGTRVRVLGTSGAWARVRLPSGGTGWVYRSYVR
jgi:SH3-like domain-containing protein